jgi:hypothetical protein
MLLEWPVLWSWNRWCNGTSCLCVCEKQRYLSGCRSVRSGILSKAAGIFTSAHTRSCLKGQVSLSLLISRTYQEPSGPEFCHILSPLTFSWQLFVFIVFGFSRFSVYKLSLSVNNHPRRMGPFASNLKYYSDYLTYLQIPLKYTDYKIVQNKA